MDNKSSVDFDNPVRILAFALDYLLTEKYCAENYGDQRDYEDAANIVDRLILDFPLAFSDSREQAIARERF